jgi:hypothetical protein
MTQAIQIFKRRNVIQRRERKLLVLELGFPIVYLALGFYIASMDWMGTSPSRTLTDYSLFPRPVPLSYNPSAITDNSDFTPKEFLTAPYSEFNDQENFQLFE